MAAPQPCLRSLLCGFFLLVCVADILGEDQHGEPTQRKNAHSPVPNSTQGDGHAEGYSLLPTPPQSSLAPVSDKDAKPDGTPNITAKQKRQKQHLTDSDGNSDKNSAYGFSSTEKAPAERTNRPPPDARDGAALHPTEKGVLAGEEGGKELSGTPRTNPNTARPASGSPTAPEHSEDPGEVEGAGEGGVVNDSSDGSVPAATTPEHAAGKNTDSSTSPEKGQSAPEGPGSAPGSGAGQTPERRHSTPGGNNSEPGGQPEEAGEASQPARVNTTTPPGGQGKPPRGGGTALTDADLHNVVHSALTSDYDGEMVDQTSSRQGEPSTAIPIQPGIYKVSYPQAEDADADADAGDTDIVHAPVDGHTTDKAGGDDGAGRPAHKIESISNRIQHVQGNGEGTYFLADPSQDHDAEVGEELHNTIAGDDDVGEDDYYDDYYYDDDDEDWYYDDDDDDNNDDDDEDDDDDEYSDIDDGEDEFQGFDDDDYYYNYDEKEDDSDTDTDSDADAAANDGGGTYEPGVMTDAEWIMREGAKEYHIGQELHDFDTHLGPMPGSENELRHVPFEYEPSYDGNNMSLIVFYTWLGVVAFMVIVALIALKHRQKISNLFWETKTGYRRDRSRLVTEEGHTLLSHQHV